MSPHSRQAWFEACRWLRWVPVAVLAGVLLAAGHTAYRAGLKDKPEWPYLRMMALLEPSESMGGDKMCFGYLPGFAAVVRPFFVNETVGLPLFIAVNLASVVGIFALLRPWLKIDDGPSASDAVNRLWRDGVLVSLLVAPAYLAIQNNQIVAPSVFLLLAAWRWIERGRWTWGASLLSLACLVKSLPLTLVGYLLLTRRFVTAGLTVAVLGVVSLVACAALFGVGESWRAHLHFPQSVRMQEPARALSGEPPISYNDNQSLAAIIIQSSAMIGEHAAWLLRYGIFAISALVAGGCTWRFGRETGYERQTFLMWLAWTVLAAPFGRYYYLLFLVPVWVGDAGLRKLLKRYPWLVSFPPLLMYSKNEELLIAVFVLSFLASLRPFLVAWQQARENKTSR